MAEQSLQIKRNKTIFDTKEEAVNHLKSLVEKLDDGEIVLCRYFSNETIQTLVGFETKYEIVNEVTQEPQVVQAIAYVDSFNEIGDGFYRDDNSVIQLNVGDGLTIDNNKVKVVVGDGLKIGGGAVQIKLDDKVNNFIHVDNDGIKVTDMKTNVTKTNDKILVMGGPLAELTQSVFPKDEDNNTYIAPNTNLQDLLLKLFCEEIYPLITSDNSKSGSTKSYVNDVTMSLSKTGEQEVGTYVTVNASITKLSSVKTTASTVNDMTYGYSKTLGGKKDSTDNQIAKDPVCVRVTSDEYKIECLKISNFTNTTFFTTVKTSGDNLPSLTNYNLGKISEGENEIEIKFYGQRYNYTIDEIEEVYPCSNIGQTKSDVKTTKVESVSGITTTPTKTASATVTGVRYGFYGKVDEPEDNSIVELNSSVIRGLTSHFINTNKMILNEVNVQQFIVAIPQSWNKKIVEVFDPVSKQDITSTYKLIKECDVEGANNYTATAYDVYVYNPAQGLILESVKHEITFGDKE